MIMIIPPKSNRATIVFSHHGERPIFFFEIALPPLSKGLDDPPPPLSQDLDPALHHRDKLKYFTSLLPP